LTREIELVFNAEIQSYIRKLISDTNAPKDLKEFAAICKTLLAELQKQIKTPLQDNDIFIFADMLRSSETVWSGEVTSSFCRDLFMGPEGWPPNVDEFLNGEQGYYFINPVTFLDEDEFYASIRDLIEDEEFAAIFALLSTLATGSTAWESGESYGSSASSAISLAMLWTFQAAGERFNPTELIPAVSAAGSIDYFDQERELAGFLNSDKKSEFQFSFRVNEFIAMALGFRKYRPLESLSSSITLVDCWNHAEDIPANKYVGNLLNDVLRLLTDAFFTDAPSCKEALYFLKNSIDGIPWFVILLNNRDPWEWIVDNMDYQSPWIAGWLSESLGCILDEETVAFAYRSVIAQHLNTSIVQEWQHLLLRQ
jgi:hypothetical protein